MRNFYFFESVDFSFCEDFLLPLSYDENAFNCAQVCKFDACSFQKAKLRCPDECAACAAYGCVDTMLPWILDVAVFMRFKLLVVK